MVSATNQDISTLKNLRLVVETPPGLSAVSGTGASASIVQGAITRFESIKELSPSQRGDWRIQCRAGIRGSYRVICRIIADDLAIPHERNVYLNVF